MTDWISVKDKMPKCGELVLIYIANLNDGGKGAYALDKSRKVNGKKEWEFYNRRNADFDVTHWAPLPQKPKSEDDAENSCMKEASEGEWIVHYNDIFPVESTEECSICHAEQYINGNDDNYCPNCGAKMKQKKGDAE